MATAITTSNRTAPLAWSDLCFLEPRLAAIAADIEACAPSSSMPGYWQLWSQFEQRLNRIGLSPTAEAIAHLRLAQIFQQQVLITCQARARSATE